MDSDLRDGLAGGRVLAQSGNDRQDDLALTALDGDRDLAHSGGTHQGRYLRGAPHRRAVDAEDPVARREAGRVGGHVRDDGSDDRRRRRRDPGIPDVVGAHGLHRHGKLLWGAAAFDPEHHRLIRPDDDVFHRGPPVGNRFAGDRHDPVPRREFPRCRPESARPHRRRRGDRTGRSAVPCPHRRAPPGSPPPARSSWRGRRREWRAVPRGSGSGVRRGRRSRSRARSPAIFT